mmetsp:Transcript_13878/g.33571  ORF Transcript_13878/g.33571 Transcript_13878/m.33571 type:complete len:231 (+) Transcript_13878:121-813(+)
MDQSLFGLHMCRWWRQLRRWQGFDDKTTVLGAVHNFPNVVIVRIAMQGKGNEGDSDWRQDLVDGIQHFIVRPRHITAVGRQNDIKEFRLVVVVVGCCLFCFLVVWLIQCVQYGLNIRPPIMRTCPCLLCKVQAFTSIATTNATVTARLLLLFLLLHLGKVATSAFRNAPNPIGIGKIRTNHTSPTMHGRPTRHSCPRTNFQYTGTQQGMSTIAVFRIVIPRSLSPSLQIG